MMLIARYQTYGIKCPVSYWLIVVKDLLIFAIDMTVDQDNLRRKNEELVQAFREKSRKQLQTQELYDKLKRRAMLGQVQNAASDAVDHTIQASVTANRLVARYGNQNQPTSQDAVFPQQRATGAHFPSVVPEVEMGPPIGRVGNGDAAWSVFNSQENSHRTFPMIWTLFE
jgi:E3 ubiquitin-protein ligase CCNP1IP1